ncbi:MAG: hypothetical protein Q9202_001680 [Teloschistes flavicans]
MGKKRKQLSHEEIWDDSALLDSWDTALQEYQFYHSIHARGERVEDVLDQAEASEKSPDRLPANPANGVSFSEDLEDGEVADGQIEDGPPMDTAVKEEFVNLEQDDIPIQQGDAPTSILESTIQSAPLLPEIPSSLTNVVKDQDLKNVMMSWYYAGYYTGLYEGQKKSSVTGSRHVDQLGQHFLGQLPQQLSRRIEVSFGTGNFSYDSSKRALDYEQYERKGRDAPQMTECQSPSTAAENNLSPPFAKPGPRIPPLWRWSDIVWLLRRDEAKGQAGKLKYIIRNDIVTPVTRAVMEYITSSQPESLSIVRGPTFRTLTARPRGKDECCYELRKASGSLTGLPITTMCLEENNYGFRWRIPSGSTTTWFGNCEIPKYTIPATSAFEATADLFRRVGAHSCNISKKVQVTSSDSTQHFPLNGKLHLIVQKICLGERGQARMLYGHSIPFDIKYYGRLLRPPAAFPSSKRLLHALRGVEVPRKHQTTPTNKTIQKERMYPITLILPLLISLLPLTTPHPTPESSAGVIASVPSFSLVERFPVNGCYLNVDSICGDCSTQLKVGATASCNELHPGVFKWQICNGGELSLDTTVALYPVTFKRGGCKQLCEFGSPDNEGFFTKGKYAGAECDAV